MEILHVENVNVYPGSDVLEVLRYMRKIFNILNAHSDNILLSPEIFCFNRGCAWEFPVTT